MSAVVLPAGHGVQGLIEDACAEYVPTGHGTHKAEEELLAP